MTERFCHKKTRGFTISHIQGAPPENFVWKPPTLSQDELESVKTTLSQPFTFLASGGQCYVFLSQDQKVVLKLFKYHRLQVPSVLKKISLPSFMDGYRVQFIKEREKKYEAFFQSCAIAYEELREETGLLYLHLGEAELKLPSLTLIDKLGIHHVLKTDQLSFALQKHADLTLSTLQQLIEQNNLQDAQEKIASLLKLLSIRCQKGIGDSDSGIKRNFGTFENHALYLDIGSFTKNESLKDPTYQHEELILKTAHLKRWLLKHAPTLVPFYQTSIDHIEQQ